MSANGAIEKKRLAQQKHWMYVNLFIFILVQSAFILLTQVGSLTQNLDW